MKKNTTGWFGRTFLISLVTLSVLVSNCTKPTTIGGDLVNENELHFGTVDTMALKVTTVRSTDSLESYIFSSLSFSLPSYYLGQLEDPIFGLNSAEIIAQYGPYPGDYASDFVGATVDSVILTLILDSAGFYGDQSAMQSLAVARLVEPLKMDTSYYTFQDYATETALLGEKTNFVPNLEQRILVTNLDRSNVDSNAVYLQIPLAVSFGQELLSLDSIDYLDGDDFAEKFKGLKIYSTATSTGMIDVALNSALSKIDVHYHTTSEDSLVFAIHPLSGYAATDRQSKDYSGSFVDSHIDVVNDSLFFMQSTGGLNMDVELPDLSALGDVIINKAIMEFTIASLMMDDTTMFKGLDQLVVKDTSNGFVIDVNQGVLYSQSLRNFDGAPKLVTRNGETRMVVQMNISSLLQEVLYGNLSNKIVIKPSPFFNNLVYNPSAEITDLGRLVFQGFAGPSHWQPKLYVNYTELN